MTSNKERGSRLGKTALNTTVITVMEKNRAKVSSSGKMEVSMKECFRITISKEREYIPGRTEDDTKESGRTIKCMGRVFSPGRMARSTTEST